MRSYQLPEALAQFKELEFHIGLCSVQYELPTLLALTAAGRLSPEVVVSHRMALGDGPEAYRLYGSREEVRFQKRIKLMLPYG